MDLLGALAYGELTAFERLAGDSRLAPTLADKSALAEMSVAEFGHFCRCLSSIFVSWGWIRPRR